MNFDELIEKLRNENAIDWKTKAIDELSEKVGKKLPKGGGAPVDVAAKELVAEQGAAILDEVAKVHFRNAARAVGLPEPPR